MKGTHKTKTTKYSDLEHEPFTVKRDKLCDPPVYVLTYRRDPF